MCINETQINDQETSKMHTQENDKETSTYKRCIILAKDSANPKQIISRCHNCSLIALPVQLYCNVLYQVQKTTIATLIYLHKKNNYSQYRHNTTLIYLLNKTTKLSTT